MFSVDSFEHIHHVVFRGDEFCTTFAEIGEVRCLIPYNINLMVLTATATMETFHIVSERLSLHKPLVVAVSPNRENIKLIVQPSKKNFPKLLH